MTCAKMAAFQNQLITPSLIDPYAMFMIINFAHGPHY